MHGGERHAVFDDYLGRTFAFDVIIGGMTKIIALFAALILAGCIPTEERLQLRKELAREAALKANAIITVEQRAACLAAARSKWSTFAPQEELVAAPEAAEFARTTGFGRVLPSRGGTYVVFVASQDYRALLGNKMRGFGGCSFEMVGGQLYLLEGLGAEAFRKDQVFVL